MKVYSVTPRYFHEGGDPTVVSSNWKNRINHFAAPFHYAGAEVHDMRINVFEDGVWRQVTPPSGHYIHLDFKNTPLDFKVDLRILHYHTLCRPNSETTEFIRRRRSEILNAEEHPRHYLDKLVTE